MGGFSKKRVTTRKSGGNVFGNVFTKKPTSEPVTEKKARKLQRRKKNKLIREHKSRTIQPVPPVQQKRQLDKWQTPPFDPRLPVRF